MKCEHKSTQSLHQNPDNIYMFNLNRIVLFLNCNTNKNLRGLQPDVVA